MLLSCVKGKVMKTMDPDKKYLYLYKENTRNSVSDWDTCVKWNWKLHKAQSRGAWMGVTQDQVGSLLWMILGMSTTHQHTTVTADQANGNEREHCNPFRRSDCTTFVKVSLLLPLQHFSLTKAAETSAGRQEPGEENNLQQKTWNSLIKDYMEAILYCSCLRPYNNPYGQFAQ